MDAMEKEILDDYARDYSIEAISYQILGMMLDEKYVEERLKLFNVNDMYIYGGTYMAVQLYRVGKKYADVKGIVDKSGKIILNDKIPVILLDEFREMYRGEKVIITPLRYFKNIKKDLEGIVDVTNIIDIGELLFGMI